MQGLRATPHCGALFAHLGDSEPVAYVLYFWGYSSFRAGPIANVHDIYVADSARRRGVARALLREVEARARARGGAKVTLEVLAEGNPNARKLYEDEGFEFHSACGLPRGTVARQPRRMRTLPPERSGVWREDPLRAVSLRHRAALPPAAPAQRPRTMACLLLAPSCA